MGSQRGPATVGWKCFSGTGDKRLNSRPGRWPGRPDQRSGLQQKGGRRNLIVPINGLLRIEET